MGIEDLAQRNLKRAGEPLTITAFEDATNDDAYGDPSFTETTTTGRAIFRKPGREEAQVVTPGGVQQPVDIVAYVSTTHRTEIRSAGDQYPKASELTRERTGEVYRVLDVWDEGNGQLRVFCIRPEDY